MGPTLPLTDPDPQNLLELLWLQAVALQEQGQYPTATAALEQLRLYAVAQREAEQALRAVLALIRLYQFIENASMAQLYAQMASEWLPQVNDALLVAETLLRVATLAPDIGHYQQGEEMALQALRLYETQGNMQGVCESWLLLFIFHNHTGRYQSAGVYLRQAEQLLQTRDLGTVYQVAVLNQNAHWNWYRGELVTALRCAEQAVELADATGQQKQRVENRVIAGNLERALGEYRKAQIWYQQAERLARGTVFSQFVGWVDVQQAWLAILQEHYGAARKLLHRTLQTQNQGQAITVGVVQAILYSLTERTDEATELLQRSLTHYLESGNLVAANTLRLHLAANWLRRAEPVRAAEELRTALGWMADQRIDYLPHWWHPPTLTLVCTHALQRGIEAQIAEQILLRHLGALALVSMKQLQTSADPAVRQRADVLEILESDPLTALGETLDPPVRAVLADLLTRRRLLPESLNHLTSLLMTAEQRNSPNPTLVAVFGLFVQGLSRKEIAAQLHLSTPTVRNYINHIFKSFELPYNPAERDVRRQQLRARALAAGYIGAETVNP
ncbi:MAG: LuxR C-terminal-related transcriptional regulator [Caldilinea sp.]